VRRGLWWGRRIIRSASFTVKAKTGKRREREDKGSYIRRRHALTAGLALEIAVDGTHTRIHQSTHPRLGSSVQFLQNMIYQVPVKSDKVKWTTDDIAGHHAKQCKVYQTKEIF
jgi:hypothetical protein